MKRNLMLWLLVVLLGASPAVQAQDKTPSPPCAEPEARQFDFWTGEWEVHARGRVVGHNRISRIHGGCTLLEEYDTQPGTYEGKSFNYYDADDGQWHQVWVDSGGARLHLSGGFADGQMIMSDDGTTAEQVVINRITWTDNPDGTVRQEWDVSKDGGATWKTIFDGLYKRLTPATNQEK